MIGQTALKHAAACMPVAGKFYMQQQQQQEKEGNDLDKMG